MASLKQLASKMDDLSDSLEAKASESAIEVAVYIVKLLAYTTPVDVSTALSGWQIGLGSPVSLRRLAFYQGQKGSTYQVSAEVTVADAGQRLKAKVPGQVIYISNLEPYIRNLNAGSSRQAPAGFVEMAVIKGRELIRSKQRESANG